MDVLTAAANEAVEPIADWIERLLVRTRNQADSDADSDSDSDSERPGKPSKKRR